MKQTPKVVVTSFGSAGDVNPVLAVASQLNALGVDVRFVANPFYRSYVEQRGLRFVAAGSHFDIFATLESETRYAHPVRGGPLVWRDLVAPSIRDTYRGIEETLRDERADLVVTHCLGFGGGWAAKDSGVPYATLAPTPFAWPSTADPGSFANWRAPRPIQSALVRALRWVIAFTLGRALSALSQELGRAPRVTFESMAGEAELNLGLWTPRLRAPARDDPPHSRICGMTFGEAGGGLDAELDAFLREGSAPIVVALGSAASRHADTLFQAVSRSAIVLEQRCVLVGAKREAFRGQEGTCVVPYASYRSLFPRASLVVQHGGIGTLAEVLRAGRPSLVTPFAFDHFDTAWRAESMGVALRCARGLWKSPQLTSALSKLLASDAFLERASEVQKQLVLEGDGAVNAASLLVEALPAPHRP